MACTWWPCTLWCIYAATAPPCAPSPHQACEPKPHRGLHSTGKYSFMRRSLTAHNACTCVLIAPTTTVLPSQFCSPSRSSLLSGRHPIHVNVHNDGIFQPGFGIPEEMTLLPRKLNELGYTSHHVGKWHCGFSTPSRTPRGRGFASSLG
jgi:hypothetical protein